MTQETPQKLPWKILDKARKFICGILNGGGQGIIYFGIGDSCNTSTSYKHGEIIGLEVEDLRDEISKAFQSTLDDHIESDNGKMTKGGDMNCVNLYFVPVWESEEPTSRYVIEIEVIRDWMFCQDNIYYFLKWSEKRPNQRGKSHVAPANKFLFFPCRTLAHRSWVIPLKLQFIARTTYRLNLFYSRICQQSTHFNINSGCQKYESSPIFVKNLILKHVHFALLLLPHFCFDFFTTFMGNIS